MGKVKKIISAMCALFFVLGLVACGERVEIPPAHMGKVLTKNGYAPETLGPSKFRLPWCWAYCDKLVLLETRDTGFKETFTIFMPKDKLNLSVEVRGTLTIPSTKGTTDPLFDRVVAEELDDQLAKIPASMVYLTYGQQAMRGIVRSEIVKYTIQEILEERDSISGNIHNAIT